MRKFEVKNIECFNDLAKEKARLKKHIAQDNKLLLYEVEMLPSRLLGNWIWNSVSGLATKTGISILERIFDPRAKPVKKQPKAEPEADWQSEELEDEILETEQEPSFVRQLAYKTGMFISSELIAHLVTKKEVEETEDDN